MNISYQDFLPSERLTINERSPRDAGRAFGNLMKPQIHEALRALWKQTTDSPASVSEKAMAYYRVAKDLAGTDVFVDGSVNYLQRYLDVLEGFCEGASIALAEGVMLQIETSLGCQTMMVRDAAGQTAFLHTEENTDDADIVKLYQEIQLHGLASDQVKKKRSLYNYRVVDATVEGKHTTSFAYPGLCYGGPAMAVNHVADTFIAVDALYTKERTDKSCLWANALAFIVFDIGIIDGVRRLIARLQKANLYILGGYAMHMLHSKELFSLEFGGNFIIEVSPDIYGKKQVIVQGNYPRSSELMAENELTPPKKGMKDRSLRYSQLYIEFLRRTDRLQTIAKDFSLSFRASADDVLDRLLHILADPKGDIETFKNKKVYVGFVNAFLAGYSVGFISHDGASIVFGKLMPQADISAPYRFWYGVDSEYDKKYAGIDLLDEAKRYA